jgi:antirestriction protein ArdC
MTTTSPKTHKPRIAKPKKKYDGPTPEEKLCERLIQLIESGVSPWRKEWKGKNYSIHRNLITGEHYHGGNPMMLEFQASFAGQSLPLWCGIGQAKTKNWFPKKGSHGAYILRPQLNSYDKKDEAGNVVKNESGDNEKVSWVSYKTACVFNAEDLQGEGIAEAIAAAMGAEKETSTENERIANAESILFGYGKREEIEYNFFGDRAFYSVLRDQITVPLLKSFSSAQAFYATLAHECVHSTGHSKRLDRKFGVQNASEESMRNYAKEELVAEMGAFILCNRMNVSSNTENHAAYLEAWLKVLKEGPKALFKAVSDATKAANLICPEKIEAAVCES